jgi:hypothetical protein
MFDIALGIDSEISGYDNIRLRGLTLGLTAKEIEERMADIVPQTSIHVASSAIGEFGWTMAWSRRRARSIRLSTPIPRKPCNTVSQVEQKMRRT